MFMLWAIPAGILAGLAIGGRLGNLSTLRFRWAWLAVAGLLVQLVLFTPTGDALAGNAGPPIYVASTLAVFVAVLRNIRLPGMPVVLFGSLSNLARDHRRTVASCRPMPRHWQIAGLPARRPHEQRRARAIRPCSR